MRIGINAFPLRREGGGARYVFAGLMTALLKHDGGRHRYIVFAHLEALGLVYEILKAAGEPLGGTGPDPRVKVVHIQDEGQVYGHRFDFDLYFGPLNNLNPRLYDRPTVAILHDIQEQYFPENFPKSELVGRREVYPDIARSATDLVAISEYCKQSFVEKFGTDPAKIEVVYNAPQARLVDRPCGDDGCWARPVALPPGGFLFYPANSYKHKNHGLVLDALEKMRAEDPADCPRVVFCGFELPGGFPLRKEIAARGLKGHCHVFTDLPVEELRYLYRKALAVVLPTTFEGFCMPAVEAAACGCPVICSDLPALREVMGDTALYFNPHDADALVSQVRRLSADAQLRAQLIEGGSARAARFTWDASAERMLDLFDAARDRFAWGRHAPGTIRRPRIGVLVRPTVGGQGLIPTVESLLVNGYPDLVIRCPAPPDLRPDLRKFLESAGVQLPPKPEEIAAAVTGPTPSPNGNSNGHGNGDGHPGRNGQAPPAAPPPPPAGFADLRAFAEEHHLDLVAELIEGHKFKITALDSAGWAYLDAPDKAVHLGEAMDWRGEAFVGIARLRLSGDGLWRLEGFLYPEMMFLNPRALADWPDGLRAATDGGDEWRWDVLCAARRAGQLNLPHRTLADCNQHSIGYHAGRRAIKLGMNDFHDAAGNGVRDRLLRRVEPAVKRAARILPMKWQDAGTRIWYHFSR